jgi:hypothetical protein
MVLSVRSIAVVILNVAVPRQECLDAAGGLSGRQLSEQPMKKSSVVPATAQIPLIRTLTSYDIEDIVSHEMDSSICYGVRERIGGACHTSKD